MRENAHMAIYPGFNECWTADGNLGGFVDAARTPWPPQTHTPLSKGSGCPPSWSPVASAAFSP